MKNKIIRYEIESNNGYFRLFKIIETKTGMNMIVVYKGTKNECLEEKRRLENEKNRL